MSNIKEVVAGARVAFNWMDELSDADAALIGKLFCHPSIGLDLNYQADGYDDNDNGGKTAMYLLTIDGQEALNYGFLAMVKDILAKADRAALMKVRDMEFYGTPGPWEHL